jgi:YegS/Rv2252/BmrU family lipid kinase
MAPVRRLCLIVNPNAGGGRTAKALPQVEQALAQHGLEHRVELTVSIDHAIELARGAAERGEVAVSYGGDGLAGAVAHGLRDTDGILGVLPGGRGNDFARKLGISQDAGQAAEVLATGGIREIDVATTNGRAYLGIASAGIDSDCQDIALDTKLKLGSFVYVYSILRALRGWKPANWTVTIDGETHTFSGYSVGVSNSGMFGGGIRYVPDASLDDGLLDVVLNADSSKLDYLRGLPKAFKGTHVDAPSFTILRAREVTFEADRPYVAYADGDPLAELPCTIRVHPRALRVLAP